MAQTTKNVVEGREEILLTYKVKKWLCFSWKILVSTETVGQDVYIESNQPIRHVYLNGKIVN